jgi:hypothetical protein
MSDIVGKVSYEIGYGLHIAAAVSCAPFANDPKTWADVMFNSGVHCLSNAMTKVLDIDGQKTPEEITKLKAELHNELMVKTQEVLTKHMPEGFGMLIVEKPLKEKGRIPPEFF